MANEVVWRSPQEVPDANKGILIRVSESELEIGSYFPQDKVFDSELCCPLEWKEVRGWMYVDDLLALPMPSKPGKGRAK